MTQTLKLFPQEPSRRLIRLDRPLLYPAIDPLSALAVREVVHARAWRDCCPSSEATLSRLCATLDSAYADGKDAYPGLHDELSDHLRVEGLPTFEAMRQKVASEFRAYCRLADRALPFWRGDGDEFVENLLQVHGRLAGGVNSLRRQAVCISPDRRGNSILFPEHTEVLPQLRRLHAFLRAHAERHPALCAAVAYAAIVYAHPFADGNGRTARTVYNLLFALETGTRHFVPIHLITSRDLASFLIKLRRALYGGDWVGLQAFFADATRLSHRLQAPIEAAAPTDTEQASVAALAVDRFDGAGR